MISNSDFKCINPHIGNNQFSNILEASLINYYNWGFLQIGGWTAISINTSGHYGGNFSQLRPVTDPAYSNGQVWEAARKDWVWESGVNYVDINGATGNPYRPSGLQVNSVSVTGGYHIDYPNGRLIFSSGISQAATVKLAYCFKNVNIISANSPLWAEIQKDSYRVDNAQYLQSQSGNWSILSQHRVQLPLIVIEAVPRGGSNGWELGDHALEVTRDVMFTVLAENRGQRNNIVDILANQNDRSIYLIDTNTMATSGAFPLNASGGFRANNTYPVLASGYQYGETRMTDAMISDVESIHPSLYMGIVRTTFNSIIGGGV